MQAASQAYPSKPVHIVVNFPPGGSSDAIARILSPLLSDRLGQPVVVENRPGGGNGRGNIGATYVAGTAPDGYTLLISGVPIFYTLSTAPGAPPPYELGKDFAPITRLVTSPMVIAVNPSNLPVNSIKELLPVLKGKPGLAFGSGGKGSGMHLAGEAFKQLSSVDITHVPYKGNGPALNDLVGGQIPIAFIDLGSASRFLKAGRLRVLAVASAQRSALAPEIPTAAESGLPGWEALGSFGLFGPGGLPAAIVRRLNTEVSALLLRADIRERVLATGNEPAPMTPEDFWRFLATDMQRWVKRARDSGQTFD
jgi:tripartite-type tricarboxylate transporter receptor subunit TctC